MSSCNKDEEKELVSFYHSTSFEVSIKNNAGEDLLDPNNPNSYNENEIKIFYLINGEMEEVYDALMDSPRNFFIFKSESEYKLRLFLDYSTDFTTTYIKWNESEMDTIQAEIFKTEGLTAYSKAWYNNEIVCENARGGCFFEIVK